MRCADCKRELEVGDQYIEATGSEFAGEEANPDIDGLLADIMDSDRGDKIVFCANCTRRGGDHLLQTVYGDEDVAA